MNDKQLDSITDEILDCFTCDEEMMSEEGVLRRRIREVLENTGFYKPRSHMVVDWSKAPVWASYAACGVFLRFKPALHKDGLERGNVFNVSHEGMRGHNCDLLNATNHTPSKYSNTVCNMEYESTHYDNHGGTLSDNYIRFVSDIECEAEQQIVRRPISIFDLFSDNIDLDLKVHQFQFVMISYLQLLNYKCLIMPDNNTISSIEIYESDDNDTFNYNPSFTGTKYIVWIDKSSGFIYIALQGNVQKSKTLITNTSFLLTYFNKVKEFELVNPKFNLDDPTQWQTEEEITLENKLISLQRGKTFIAKIAAQLRNKQIKFTYKPPTSLNRNEIPYNKSDLYIHIDVSYDDLKMTGKSILISWSEALNAPKLGIIATYPEVISENEIELISTHHVKHDYDSIGDISKIISKMMVDIEHLKLYIHSHSD